MNRRIAYLTLAFGWLAISGFSVMGARASLITDIPDGINDAVFDGESLIGAQLMLSAAILTSAALCLGILKLPVLPMAMILLAVSFALIGVAWMPYWVAIFEALLIAGMLAKSWGGMDGSGGSS